MIWCLHPSFCRYQVILPGDRGTRTWTTCQRLLLDSTAAWDQTQDHWGPVFPQQINLPSL